MANYTLKNIKEDLVWESENIFYLKSTTERLGKCLAHYEIFKMIYNVPGDIVELGVFKGVSLSRWATFCNLLENEKSRSIYGFDDFGAFTTQKETLDKDFIKSWADEAGSHGIDNKELEKIFEEKNINNVYTVKGDILKTIPEFLLSKPQLKISILHIDVDVYIPTKFALETMFENVTRGGIILLDDYATTRSGATKAIDEFLSNNHDLKVNKLNFNRLAYIKKP